MKLQLLYTFIFVSSVLVNIVFSHVRKFRQADFDKWLDPDNYLVVLFCSSMTDQSCMDERQKMTTVSEQLINYKDVLFGYVDMETDAVLISRYDIRKFPAIKLFPYQKSHQNLPPTTPIPIYKEKIMSIREEHMKSVKHSESTTKTISLQRANSIIEIEASEMESTVKNPEKHAILIIYETDCKEGCQIMEKVAKIFEKDKEIGFFKMSLHKTGLLRKSFSFPRNPTIYWYPIGAKDGYIYGGQITFKIMVEYINDRAGLSRSYDGDLKENAGRIAEIDQIIQENIQSILEKSNINEVINQVQRTSKDLPHNKKYIDYYLSILKEIRKGNDPGQVLNHEQDFLNKKLSKDKANIKEVDEWRKYYNIISAFVDFAAKHHQAERAKMASRKENKVPGLKEAKLKEDPSWKMGFKHRSHHDEL